MLLFYDKLSIVVVAPVTAQLFMLYNNLLNDQTTYRFHWLIVCPPVFFFPKKNASLAGLN